MKVFTHYFPEASQDVTLDVLEIVKQFMNQQHDIKKVVVATTTGFCGAIFAKEFGERAIVVTHHTGFRTLNENEIDPEKKAEIERNGAKILTTTHAFAGVARGIRFALGTYSTTELLAYAFRTFGQGTKVCAEIAMMAADAGLISVDRDVVCVGGTGRGADTAWVVRPANTNAFTDLKMRACLCKPLEF